MTTVMPGSTHFVYRADIDGLRALAVAMVLLFHFDIGLSGGYVGVDVFFVISGYLITQIIDRDVAAGKFSYLKFWERRIRRLLPALAVMSVAVLLAGYLILVPNDFQELGQGLLAMAVGLANVHYWHEAGYFDGPSELKPLLHTWSLAVEEQFYLVMPLFLIGVHRLFRNRSLAIMVLLACASLLWSVIGTPIYPVASFFLLPARAWELLLGGIAAECVNRITIERRTATTWSVIGIAAILWSGFAYSETTVFPGIAATVPCFGAAILIVVGANHSTFVSKILAFPSVVFVGKISYSLYLWHWPIIVFAKYLHPTAYSTPELVLLMGLAVVMGALSWRFVETPFRIRKQATSPSWVYCTAATVLSSIAIIGLGLHLSDGIRGRFSSTSLAYADAMQDRYPTKSDFYNVPERTIEQKGLSRIDDCPGDQPPRLAIIGDSHGNAMLPVMQDLAKEMAVPTVFISRSATIPLIFDASGPRKEYSHYYESVRKQLQRLVSLTDVVVIARWGGYPDGMLTQQAWERTLRGFESLGLRVWIVLPIPDARVDVPRALAVANSWGMSTTNIPLSQQEVLLSHGSAEKILKSVAGTNLQFVDPVPYFFTESSIAKIVADGRSLYYDDNHLSTYGARWLRPCFEPMFQFFSTSMNENASAM